jgi:hypothetical protein
LGTGAAEEVSTFRNEVDLKKVMNHSMKIVSSSGKGNFKLLEADREVYELEYTNWFSGKATVLYQGNSITLKPKNIWTSKVDIFRNDRSIGDLTFTLSGEVIIRIEKSPEKDSNYILKNKGMWKLRFELYDDTDTLLLTMTSINNWTKLSYDYDIALEGADLPANPGELLVYCGYAANLYLAHTSAA